MSECRSSTVENPLPSAPSGLTLQDGTSKVILNWSDNDLAEGVLNYQVYRSLFEGGPFTLLGSPTTSNFDDTTGTQGTLYWYRVTAVNSAGESPYTAISGKRTTDSTPPSPPTILTTTVVGAASVQITWSPPVDSDLAGFKVYSRTGAGAFALISGSALLTTLQFIDAGATAGSTWDFRVTALDLAGNESTPATTSIAVPASDTTPPAVPATPVAVNTKGSTPVISISWTPNTEPDLAGYLIYRSDDSYTASLTGATLITNSSYSDSTYVGDVVYQYKVLAKDTSGNASAKSTASNPVSVPSVAPLPTASLSASPNSITTGQSTTLTWSSTNGVTFNLLPNPGSVGANGSVAVSPATSTIYTFDVTNTDDVQAHASTTVTVNAVPPPPPPPITGGIGPFLKCGTMVPTGCHIQGVSRRWYGVEIKEHVVSSGSGPGFRIDASGKIYKLDSSTATLHDDNDFALITHGTHLTAKYFFDFASATGQDQGKYNKIRGFNAGHVYDTPGTYTPKFTRTDEAGVKLELSGTLTLLPDTRTKIYCSSGGDGSSTNDGSSISKPVSFARGVALLATSTRKLLLRNGDTFPVSGNEVQLSGSNQMISNYSDPAKPSTALPKISFSSSPSGIRHFCIFKSGCTNPVVENLEFTRSYSGANSDFKNDIAFQILGKNNALVRNCTFTKIGQVYDDDNPASDGTESAARYLIIQDCSCPNIDSLQKYFGFCHGGDLVFLGNRMANSVQEHGYRISGACRVLVAFCDLTNREPGGGDTVKTCINSQQGSDHYFYRNKLVASEGQGLAGTQQIGPLKNSPDSLLESFNQYIVFEENDVNSILEIAYGCKDVMIRNNLLRSDGKANVRVMGSGSGEVDRYGRSMNNKLSERVYILNNTILNSTKNGQLFLVNHKISTDLIIRNNLCICPQFPLVGIKDSSVCVNFAGGIDTSVMKVLRNVFPKCDGFEVSGTVETLVKFNQRSSDFVNALDSIILDSNFKFPTGNSNKAFGRPVAGVFEDYYGTARDITATTSVPGAVESTY